MVTKKVIAATVILIGIIVVSGALGWNYLSYLDETAHDTNRWAVIRDVNSDHIAFEASEDKAWNQLAELQRDDKVKFVGGIVEKFRNKWGFRFKPGSIVVADFTAEGLQATISYLSENLNYWLDGYAYVSSKVVEIHS